MGYSPLTQAGDTIIEVMMALAVLGSVLGSVAVLANRSTNSLQSSQEHSVALRLGQTQLEHLRLWSSQHADEIGTISTGYTNGFCMALNTSVTPNDWQPVAYVPPNPIPDKCKLDRNGDVTTDSFFYAVLGKAIKQTQSGVDAYMAKINVSWEGLNSPTNSINLSYRLYKKIPIADRSIVPPPPPGPPAPACPSSTPYVRPATNALQVGLIRAASVNSGHWEYIHSQAPDLNRNRPDIIYTDSDAVVIQKLSYDAKRGVHQSVIINTPDETNLNDINPDVYATNFLRIVRIVNAVYPSITQFEVINEPEEKDGYGNNQNPGQYARIYMAAVNKVRSASPVIPKSQAIILFSGVDLLKYDTDLLAGWLPTAVASAPTTLPGLIEAISTHPYGDSPDGTDKFFGPQAGWKAIDGNHRDAVALCINVPWYITEIGTREDSLRSQRVLDVMNYARDNNWINEVDWYHTTDREWAFFTWGVTPRPGWTTLRDWVNANSGPGKQVAP